VLDLLVLLLDDLVETLVNPLMMGVLEKLAQDIRPARHQCEPEVLLHGPERVLEREAAGKGFRRAAAQVK